MRTMPYRDILLLLFILLLGTALRLYGQAEMASMLHSDEAYYGLDAVSLIENPRLQVYFPANTGREGIWMHLLSPMIAGIGATPFAMRITSALVGILSIATAYRLGREMLGKDAAIWVAGTLAVVYWHVQLSHIGFRVITLPIFGALAFACLFRAHRLNRVWWQVGLFTGLLLYTYIAARVYVGYIFIWLLLWLYREKTQRRGILLSMALIILMAIPLVWSLSITADTAPSVLRAAASDASEIWQNVLNWGNAWLGRGDVSATHNLPSRPVLDVPLAVLAVLGLGSAWFTVRKKWMLIFWLGLVVVALIPTILSTETPHFLRGSGLILPLILLLGAGGGLFVRFRFGWILPLLLILWSGWNTYTDFTLWLNTETDDFGITYDYRVNEAMFILDAETPPEQPIIMPNDDGFHPTAAYIAQGMERDITFYPWSDDTACYLSPRESYTVLDLPIVLNSFASRVVPYADNITTISQHSENDYNIYTITPTSDLSEIGVDAPTFGEFLSAQVISPTENTVTAGETLEIYWAMRLENRLDRNDYRVLVHLQGDPTPYEGGDLYSTGDTPLCDLAYDGIALGDVTLIQRLQLPIPDDLAAGQYHVAMGIYEPDTFTRLSVSPPENDHNYTNAWQFTVTR